MKNSLDTYYHLRKDFAIIGLSGKSGSGCTQIARLLEEEKLPHEFTKLTINETNDIEQLKLNICVQFLSENWSSFKTIQYNQVLLQHLIFECIHTDYIHTTSEISSKIIHEYFNQEEKEAVNEIVCHHYTMDLHQRIINLNNFNEGISYVIENNDKKDLYPIFFNDENPNSNLEDTTHKILRDLFSANALSTYSAIHNWAKNLRSNGSTSSSFTKAFNLTHIYTVVETINKLIKIWRKKHKHARIVIDSFKNSLEISYFKEKYAAYYTLATKKNEHERVDYQKTRYTCKNEDDIEKIISLDDSEYVGKDVQSGKLFAPDIENCIQKSDYHLFFSNLFKLEEVERFKNKIVPLDHTAKDIKIDDYIDLKEYETIDLNVQIAKFLSLLFQPGIINPNAFERNMQIAYNAKANSGCISRQVGAVVTDSSLSVKSIGWNDIPRFQIPCNLRNTFDLINGKNADHYSPMEKGEVHHYKDGRTFLDKIKEDFEGLDKSNLNGKNCSFCFKSHHNAYEGKDNQVHTRSLHAEENAMVQITKYGGQGIKKGYLFTTASPCELCSKKAFQLGINKIFYIDPYPGIASYHVLKSGKSKDEMPKLVLFQGAVGGAFHKLYEPFISYKDELKIITNIKPKANQEEKIRSLTDDEELQQEILKLLNERKKSEE